MSTYKFTGRQVQYGMMTNVVSLENGIIKVEWVTGEIREFEYPQAFVDHIMKPCDKSGAKQVLEDVKNYLGKDAYQELKKIYIITYRMKNVSGGIKTAIVGGGGLIVGGIAYLWVKWTLSTLSEGNFPWTLENILSGVAGCLAAIGVGILLNKIVGD